MCTLFFNANFIHHIGTDLIPSRYYIKTVYKLQGKIGTRIMLSVSKARLSNFSSKNLIYKAGICSATRFFHYLPNQETEHVVLSSLIVGNSSLVHL